MRVSADTAPSFLYARTDCMNKDIQTHLETALRILEEKATELLSRGSRPVDKHKNGMLSEEAHEEYGHTSCLSRNNALVFHLQ